MQAALNALSTIGGVGGSVTVTQFGIVFTVSIRRLPGQSRPAADDHSHGRGGGRDDCDGHERRTPSTTDQRGFTRGSSVDIGAFQTQPGLAVNTTIDGTGSPSGDLSLREAVNLANALGGTEAITFDPSVFDTPRTITLDGTQLELSNTSGTETITGPAAGVTVSGGGRAGCSKSTVVSPRRSQG